MNDENLPFSNLRGEFSNAPVVPFRVVARSQPASTLGELWNELVQGRTEIVSRFASGTGELLLIRKLEAPRRALSNLSVQVLEHLLLGGSQKAFGLANGQSSSSVAMLAKRALHGVGVGCLPSRVPLLLAILVCASRQAGVFPRVRITGFERAGVHYVAVSFPPPDDVLTGLLTGAERTVTALMLEGKPYVQIAERRHTSVRTVANQVAKAFHRLRVSGRTELLALVAKSLSEPRDALYTRTLASDSIASASDS